LQTVAINKNLAHKFTSRVNTLKILHAAILMIRIVSDT
jgi:hypothetical protein